jgi:hypothetical protein
MKPFSLSLAPQNLMQAINPWTFDNQGAQIGLFNINFGQTAAPQTELAVLEEVGSYGKQLGRIGDVLELLIARVPRDGLSDVELETIKIFEGQLAEIRKVKRREAARAR